MIPIRKLHVHRHIKHAESIAATKVEVKGHGFDLVRKKDAQRQGHVRQTGEAKQQPPKIAEGEGS